jgi:hypothetical protein
MMAAIKWLAIDAEMFFAGCAVKSVQQIILKFIIYSDVHVIILFIPYISQ